MSEQKLAQRQVFSNHHNISIGLTGNLGYIEISDNGLYPDNDSRTHRRDLGFNTMLVPLMTRQDLEDLKIAVEEVLNNSK